MPADRDAEIAHEEWRGHFARGPSALRWESLPPQIGDKAPDLELADMDGNARHLSEFWSDRAALILFWRHQSCSCGYERAERLKTEYHAYVAAGANVVVIGQAEPDRAKRYAAERSIPCPILCDPDYIAYRAFGLREGSVAQVIYDAPEEYWNRKPEVWEGFIDQREEEGRPFVDHPWMLPGEFVVGTDGNLALAYHYQYCENYPDPLVHIAAIKMAPGGKLSGSRR